MCSDCMLQPTALHTSKKAKEGNCSTTPLDLGIWEFFGCFKDSGCFKDALRMLVAPCFTCFLVRPEDRRVPQAPLMRSGRCALSWLVGLTMPREMCFCDVTQL